MQGVQGMQPVPRELDSDGQPQIPKKLRWRGRAEVAKQLHTQLYLADTPTERATALRELKKLRELAPVVVHTKEELAHSRERLTVRGRTHCALLLSARPCTAPSSCCATAPRASAALRRAGRAASGRRGQPAAQ